MATDPTAGDEPELNDQDRVELDCRLDELEADIRAGKPLGDDWAQVRSRIARREARANTKVTVDSLLGLLAWSGPPMSLEDMAEAIAKGVDE